MSFLLRIFLIVGFILSLHGCPSPPNISCSKDGDCSGSEVCCEVDGEKSCQDKSDCKGKSCEGDPCGDKSDCRNDEECKAGCCVKEEIVKCSKDDDCARGKECISSGKEKVCRSCTRTCNSTTDCTGDDVCENGCCRLPSCQEDSDCSSREDEPYCDKASAKCVACTETSQCQKKEEKSVCRDNLCEPVECTNDSHCSNPSKPKCDLTANRCTEPVICKTDADCTDPQLSRCDANANGGRGACKKGMCEQCTSDDECGGPNDYCVGKDKGLKDGSRCLVSCEKNSDCKQGFICSEAVFDSIKICFPIINYCEDPCLGKQCPDKYKCVEGQCVKTPEPCDVCKSDDDCGAKAKCLQYGGGKFFCGRFCKDKSDCPSGDDKFDFACLNGQCTDTKSCEN